MHPRSAQRSSQRFGWPASYVAVVVLCLLASAVALGVGTSSARAGYYNMVLCAANNGSNSFATATNQGGQFSIENYCGPAPFPAGNSAFIRIYENTTGTANVN